MHLSTEPDMLWTSRGELTCEKVEGLRLLRRVSQIAVGKSVAFFSGAVVE